LKYVAFVPVVADADAAIARTNAATTARPSVLRMTPPAGDDDLALSNADSGKPECSVRSPCTRTRSKSKSDFEQA
jgi:hypothetical protein